MSEEVYEDVAPEGVEEEVQDTEHYEEEVSDDASMLDNEGRFNRTWVDSLPDDLGKHSIWSKYTNPVEMAKGAIHSQSLTGQKIEDFMTSDDPVVIEQRRQALGIPPSAEDYNLELSEEFSNVELDEEEVSEFKEVAHTLGLSNEQTEALLHYELMRGQNEENYLEREEEMSLTEAEETLRDVWRGNDYEYNLSKVANTLDYLGMGDFKDDPAIGNNPDFVLAFFEKICPLVGDDAVIAESNASYQTVEDGLRNIEREINQFRGHTHSADYQALIKERGELLKQQAKLKPPPSLL